MVDICLREAPELLPPSLSIQDRKDLGAAIQGSPDSEGRRESLGRLQGMGFRLSLEGTCGRLVALPGRRAVLFY